LESELPELQASQPETAKQEDSARPLTVFFLVLAAMAVIRLLTVLVGVPLGFLAPAKILVTAFFVIAPVLALFNAAKHRWTPLTSLGFIGGGVVAWLGGWALGHRVLTGLPAAVAVEISQAGLMVWSIGLGALLATKVKDKNMLIPISLFLVAFDAFLILTPTPIQKLATQPMVQSLMLASPQISTAPTRGPVQPFAVIGPADLVFMGMFFIALFRFHMRTRATFLALLPTLVIYLGLALVIGALPALVPIGLCILIVNWKEFNLNKEEWASTALVTALGAALVIWGMTRPAPPPEPLPKGVSQGAPGQASSPPPASGG
jgi:hypothetical protein